MHRRPPGRSSRLTSTSAAMRSSAKKTASRRTTASAQSSGRPEAAGSPTRNRARPGGAHAGAQSRAACLRPATNRDPGTAPVARAVTGRASPTTGEVAPAPGPTRSRRCAAPQGPPSRQAPRLHLCRVVLAVRLCRQPPDQLAAPGSAVLLVEGRRRDRKRRRAAAPRKVSLFHQH